MIVVAITASRVDIMGKLLRSGLADRTNEEGPVLTLLGAIRTDSGNPHLRKKSAEADLHCCDVLRVQMRAALVAGLQSNHRRPCLAARNAPFIQRKHRK